MSDAAGTVRAMTERINELKRRVFYDLLEIAGRVFVLIEHSEGVVIGKRGFTPEEKEKGLVLVFNSRMNFQWGDDGITARLVFGSITENCFIPVGSIISVFSPELSAQFMVSPSAPRAGSIPDEEAGKQDAAEKDGKVVKVDFSRKKS